MPRRLYTLLLTLLLAQLTAGPPGTSSAERGFNGSLRMGGGKSKPGVRKPTPPAEPFTVVIDAGHGGKDPGGMGANSHEKHIALSITRLLAIGIRTNFPDVRVVLTRADDTFIPLYQRARTANEEGADLFVSVHANIMPGSAATFGTETFVMGQHVAERNLAVAKRENAAILLEDNVEANYGYDPNSDEGHIMMSTFQHAFLDRSIRFADLVEKSFAAAGRKSRGVKQAGFAVLKNTTMPAVLVECGFMSNPTEEAYLLSPAGQRKLADALLSAFRTYYQEVTGVAVAELAPVPPPAARVTARAVTTSLRPADRASAAPPRSTDAYYLRPTWTAKGVSRPAPLPFAPPNAVAPVHRDVISREVTNAVVPRAYRSGRAATTLDTLPTGYRFTDAGARKPPPRRATDFTQVLDSQLDYAIQLAAIKKDLPVSDPTWAAVPFPITKFREAGLNKYQVRDLRTARATRAALARLKENGFRGAFAVVYFRGKRVAPGTVRYLLGRE